MFKFVTKLKLGEVALRKIFLFVKKAFKVTCILCVMLEAPVVRAEVILRRVLCSELGT
jgi:hypothetical protein